MLNGQRERFAVLWAGFAPEVRDEDGVGLRHGSHPLPVVGSGRARPIQAKLDSGHFRKLREGSITRAGFHQAEPVWWERLVRYFFAAGTAGSGRSELKVSTIHFHLPSACFFQISTNLPVSVTGAGLFIEN